jgi:hypothetical protein
MENRVEKYLHWGIILETAEDQILGRISKSLSWRGRWGKHRNDNQIDGVSEGPSHSWQDYLRF